MRSKAIFVAVVFLFVVSPLRAEILYNFVDLGILAGGDWCTANSINNSGQIVGNTLIENDYAATLFDSTGNQNNVNLGQGTAVSINDSGQIVGSLGLWDNGVVISLGTLLGKSAGIPNAISNSGQIVGDSFSGMTDSRAVLFDPAGNGNNIDLGLLPIAGLRVCGQARSINDNGQAVGRVYDIQPSGSFLWSYAVLFDSTGTGNNINLGGGGNPYAIANSINNSGQIVGADGSGKATIFDSTGNGSNINLGTLSDGGYSSAMSINDNGQIVGTADGFATLFDSTGQGKNINLNDVVNLQFGWKLSSAHSINDDGWIVGYE